MSETSATEGTAASQDSPPLPDLPLSLPDPTHPVALAPVACTEDLSQQGVSDDLGKAQGTDSSKPPLHQTHEESLTEQEQAASTHHSPKGEVSAEAASVNASLAVSPKGEPQQSDAVVTSIPSATPSGTRSAETPTENSPTKTLSEDVLGSSKADSTSEQNLPPEDMGNRLGGEKSKGKKGDRKDGKKEERREEKRRRQAKLADKKKSKCPADPDSLTTTEIEDESSSFGFHSFENLLAGALGGSKSPKHRGGASQASARDEDERDEVEWVPMSIEDEGGVQFKPDADDSSTASQGYSTPLLATPLMKRSQPPHTTAERLDQLGRSIHDTILSNLSDVRVPQERDSMALLGRGGSMDGSTDTLTLDDPAAKSKAAAAAASSGDADGRTSSGIPAHVLESRSNGSGSSTPVLRRRRDGSATNSPVLRRHNDNSSPSTPVLRRRNEGSATNSPVLRQRGNQGSAPGTPVLKQRSEAQTPRSPTLNQRHQTGNPPPVPPHQPSTAGSPPPVPPHQGSGASSPVLRHRNGNSGPGSPSLRHRNKEPGTSSPVLPPRRQDSPSSPVPRRKHETTATGSPILRLKSQNSAPGSPVLRAKAQGSGANSPVLLRRQEGSAPGSPTLRRSPGSASNSPVLRPRHQAVAASALAQSSGTQSPSMDSGLSTPASDSRPQASKAAAAASQNQASRSTNVQAAEPPPPRTYPSNRPLPFPLDVDKLTDLPPRGESVPCGMSHSLTRPATGPREPLPPLECFHASLPRDSSRDSGLSLARAAPSGDEDWMEEMFYSCQDVSFEKELHEDVLDGEQFLQTPSSPHLAPPPGDSQARARGEKPKVVSQYDNVQDAEDAAPAAHVAASSASIALSAAARPMVSGGGSKPVAGHPFGIKEQKPSQTTTTKQQSLQLSTNAGQATTATVSPGRSVPEAGRHHTVLRQNGAAVSQEPPQQAVVMGTASLATSAAAREPSQREVTEHNLQLLVRAIEKLPHMDSSVDTRDSLSMDDSLAEAEESSPTDSSFEEMGLRRVAKCVEVICAAEKKAEPSKPATPPQVSTDKGKDARGEEMDSRPTSAAPPRANTSETQVSSKEADTAADKGEGGSGSPGAFVPPPSPSALAELAELVEEDEEDEEALERQEASVQQQKELEVRLFGDSVAKRLSSLLDSLEAEEETEEPQAAALAPTTSVLPASPGHAVMSDGGSSTTTNTSTNPADALAATAREVTLATITLGEVAKSNPRPTTLPTAVVSTRSDPAVNSQAREAVVFNVASVQASRVQSEIVLESSPCVSPTSKPKSAGSVAEGDRSKSAGNGACSTTGTEQQNSCAKTQDAMQLKIVLSSQAVPVEATQVPAASERDVKGCNSVAVSEAKSDKNEGENEKKNEETESSPFPVSDPTSQAGVVKKPSIPNLLIQTTAEEAASTAEEAQTQSASHSEQQLAHPDSNTSTTTQVLFQIGEGGHLDPSSTEQHSDVRIGEDEEETATTAIDDEEGKHSDEELEQGEVTSPTPTVPKRESQQIHDVISAYWGTEETPTDTDSRTLSRSSLGSSELTGDSRSDTLSAGSRGDRLSVCTASTDSSFDDHVFTGMVFENRTYQGLQARPPGDDRPSHARPPPPGPTMEAAPIPSIVFENSARKERERPVKIPSLIFGNSSLRTEGALPGNHCRESSGNSSSEVEADVEPEDEEDVEGDDDNEGDSQEESPSRRSSKRPSTSSVESASALRVPALEETFCELQGVKTFLEELQDRTPTADRLPFFVGPEIHRPGGLGAVGGGESSAMWNRRSRMSPAVTERTESDLDASEHRDDISSTGESMYADDEDEGQDFFADDPGSEVMVCCAASYHSAPEPEGDSDGFWAECSTTEDTYQELETSMDAASSVFRNARRQMHDIHEHLQDLRRQMEMLQDDVQHARLKGSSEMDSSDFQPALE